MQAYTEIEQQPCGLGYDMNDVAMDDVIALCDRIGAEPFFTINATLGEAMRLMKGHVSGCRYQCRPGEARIEDGKLVFSLPPASQMAARVK